MGRTIAIANQKGGVGKTTTAVNLAASLAAAEKRTLIIDVDPQANASVGLNVKRGQGEATIYEFLLGKSPFEQVAVQMEYLPGLYLIPSHTKLFGVEAELASHPKRYQLLKNRLTDIQNRFDYIVIDCPPALSALTINALIASDTVIIPIQCEYYALEGLGQFLAAMHKIQKSLNPRLRIEGVLMTMFDGRLNLSQQVAQQVRSYFGNKVFKTIIPRNVRLAEAPSFGKPVLLYDASSKGANNYLNLAREIIANREAT